MNFEIKDYKKVTTRYGERLVVHGFLEDEEEISTLWLMPREISKIKGKKIVQVEKANGKLKLAEAESVTSEEQEQDLIELFKQIYEKIQKFEALDFLDSNAKFVLARDIFLHYLKKM